MAYRAGVLGGSGYAGAELLRLLAGHPEIEVVHVTADSNAGAAVGELYPALRPGLRRPPLLAARRPPTSPVSTSCSAALPHGASQALLPDLLDHVGHAVDLGADFRLPPDVYSRWYGEAHNAPEAADRFAYGLVELYRDEIADAHARRIARLLPDGREPRVRAAARARSRRAARHRRRGVGSVGRGPRRSRPRACSRRRTRTSSAYGLLTHRHTAEMEQALTKVARRPVQVLFTPHLVPTTRGILATCYARPATTGLSTARLLEHYREFYADDPCVVVVDEPSGTKATYGANVAHVTVRFDARTETVVAIAAEDNLVKGRVGSDDPGRQPAARSPGDHRPPAPRHPAVSVTAAKGYVAGGLACGIKESGDPDLALVATDDHAPVPAAAVFTTQPRAGRAGAGVAARTSPTGARPRSCSSSGNANAATGEAGRRDARRMCELTAEGLARRDHRRARVLDRAHRHPDADAPRSRPASRSSAARSRADGARATPRRRCSPPTPCARKRSRPRRERDRRRDGEGRGDAVARDGHDARGAHHRRRGRSGRAAAGARATR